MQQGGSELPSGGLQYWHSNFSIQKFKPTEKHRYICFDVDQGGLNNIRLVFEYVAIVAAITGRTLVLPPTQSWYLINHGPKTVGKTEGGTHFSEIFDIAALKQVLRVLTVEEFIEEAAQHLTIPEEFQGTEAFSFASTQDTHWKLWREWLNQHSKIPDWNPYNNLIAFPDKQRTDLDQVCIDYVDGRDFVEFTPVLNAAPIIYFPSNDKERFLGPVATMLVSDNESLPVLTRRLLKQCVRYRSDIFRMAEELINRLPGLFNYHAVHIRRNDFQYKPAWAEANNSLENIKVLLDQNLPVYIATDEVDEEFRRNFHSHGKVYFWDDLRRMGPDLDIPERLTGLVEQLICAGAYRFIGTDFSTFSTYIVRLRGYLMAPDTASYYHTECYSEPLGDPTPHDLKGRNYLKENPLYWLSC